MYGTGKDEGDLIQELMRDFAQASSNRGNWESHWQEIAERIFPSVSTAFMNGGVYGTQGEKRNRELIDSTGLTALNRFSAILDSLLTPRNSMWHKLISNNEALNKNRNVAMYFEQVNKILFKYRYAPKANFASQNQQVFKSTGAFGTGVMFIDELRGEIGLRYKHIHLGEIYLLENHQGIIDKGFRKFPFTARQAYQAWGKKCPPCIVKALETNADKIFMILHCVRPNKDRDMFRLDYKGKAYSSHYITMDEPTIVQRGGSNTFPLPTSRYELAPGEVYGRSPAMDALPAIKTLNEQKKVVLEQGHRTTRPVILVHDDGTLDSLSMKPGAINYGGVSADGRSLVQALPVGNVNVGKDLMDDERNDIKDAFLVTLFQILADNPQMTATEVMERTREKGILLAPTLGRVQSEYLGPMIERELDILSSLGVLPPMPSELLEAQGDYAVQYESPLSRAQKAEEASGLMRTVETALQIMNVTQNPDVIDHFNLDVIMPELASINAVPLSWMNDPKKIESIRKARADQAAAQQQIQAAPGEAAMIKAQTAAKSA